MEEGDALDFGAFVATRSPALFRTAFLLTGNEADAADLVQGALEKACRRWRRVGRADAPEAYVRRIIANHAVDGWRRRRRQGPAAPWAEAEEAADPVSATGRADDRDELARALGRLPVGMRTAVVLRYFDDLTDAEIAETLGVAPATVRSQIARGLAKLRADLASAQDTDETRLGGAA